MQGLDEIATVQLPNVKSIRRFVIVAEELSFTRAANERLFIAQPTLSRQIRLLEAALRARLFERDHRTVRLTGAGEILLTRARLLLGQWDETQSAVAEAAATAGMTLRVGFHTRIGRGLIPAVTARMAQLLPGWKLTFRQVSWRDPTAGLADAVCGRRNLLASGPGQRAAFLAGGRDRGPVGGAARRHTASPSKPAVTLDDLSGEPFIALPATAGTAAAVLAGGRGAPVAAADRHRGRDGGGDLRGRRLWTRRRAAGSWQCRALPAQ